MADKSTELNDDTLERVATAFVDAITGDDSGDSEEPDTSAELNDAILKRVASVFADAIGDINPSPEDISEAVSDWLDDHPEATTTVQDGSITYAKLHSDVSGDITGVKNALIVIEDNAIVAVETEKSEYHNVIPKTVTFYSDDRISVSAKYSNNKNILIGLYKTGLENGITRTLVGNILNFSGTGTGQNIIVNNIEMANTIKGKTFYIYVYLKKSTPWGNTSYLGFYDGKSYKKRLYFTQNSADLTGWTNVGAVTFAQDATQLLIKFDSLNGTSFSTGDCIWIGMYETELIDTEHIVLEDEPYTINLTNFTSVDTALHESTVSHVVKTKDYVDNHIPDIKAYWNDEIYALPEYFGAVGDGVADDGAAIASCLAYAATSGKAVRGFGKYKTTNTVIISTRYADVYLREINYIGNDTAISLQNTDIRFEFHRIVSSGSGLTFGQNAQTSNIVANRCQVNGNEIKSTGDCIVCIKKTLYNTVEIRFLSSSNGNCITSISTGEGFPASEYVFRGASCHCPNGYVAENVAVSKFYDFTVESDCKYGYLNPLACMCIGCRHTEQVDGMKLRLVDGDETFNNGPLIIFNIPPSSRNYAFVYHSWQGIPWYSIDVSQIQGFDAVGSIGEWQSLCYTGIDLGVPIKGFDNTGRRVIGNRMYFIGNNKVYVPEQRQTVVINTSIYDYRIYDEATSANMIASRAMDFGTDFIINADTEIYFNASFGAVGYNDLTLTQEQGYTAIIYDKLGNILFDGTNEGDGKWQLKCVVNRSSFGRYQGTTPWWSYDGTNEIWEIEKIS